MAPLGWVTSSVGWLAKSFTVISRTSTLARCTNVLSATYIIPVKSLTSQASGPPKRPLNGYMRYVLQQQPIMSRQNPEFKAVDVIRKIAHEWRTMSPEQKRPFEEASVRDREKFKVDLEQYKAQLTPAQVQQQTQDMREKMAKRKAIRTKRELTNLGKPKRCRSAFNIFMSEHFEKARGTTVPEKLKSLFEDWKNLFSHQKKLYTQLAEDDKIRYKNEMKSWEDHMIEIGREDLIREQTLTSKRKAAAAATATAKAAKKKTKTTKVKKTMGTAKSNTSKRTTQKSSSTKTRM